MKNIDDNTIDTAQSISILSTLYLISNKSQIGEIYDKINTYTCADIITFADRNNHYLCTPPLLANLIINDEFDTNKFQQIMNKISLLHNYDAIIIDLILQTSDLKLIKEFYKIINLNSTTFNNEQCAQFHKIEEFIKNLEEKKDSKFVLSRKKFNNKKL